MASGLNKVMIIGNLGRDPEVRYTQSGSAVANLRVAVNERRKEGDSWKDHVEWVTVIVFGKTAENVAQYMSKGRSAYYEGRLQTRQWKDKDGNERWSTEVVASNVIFLGGNDSGGEQRHGNKSSRARDNRDAGDDARTDDPGFYDDDLPF